MSKTIIEFKIDGPKLKDTLPLLDVISALQEFHNIVDKAYLSSVNGKKIYPTDRENYGIVATEFKKGSFIAELQLTVAATMQILPNLPGSSYKDIWEIAKGSYDLLKALAVKRSSGIEPVINIYGDSNSPIIIGNNITISNVVFNAADKSEFSYKKLTALIRPGEVDVISSFDKEGREFALTTEDKTLFNPKTRLENIIFPIECDIFKYDKLTKSGRMTVFDGQAVPPKEYAFKPVKSSDTHHFIQAMARHSVKVNVLKEIEVHTTGVERISALHVVSIEDFKTPGLFD